MAQSALEAQHWLEQAAAQGDARAEWNLGALLAAGGAGVARDLERALDLCSKASDRGFVAAKATLGMLFAATDRPAEAVALLRVAAEAGDPEAQFNLAQLLLKGQGCARDERGAFVWFLAAAEQGIAAAQSRLGLMYATGEGVCADPIEAHKWFVVASRADDAPARANRARSALQLGASQIEEAERRADAWKAGFRAAGLAAPRP